MIFPRIHSIVFALMALAFSATLFGDKFEDRVNESREVYEELLNAPDRGVPEELLSRCKCVAVIPHVVKAAFGFGGRHGAGIVSCRNSGGTWSPPAFVKISGGSFGFQIGGQASDFVLFLMTEKSARALLKSKFTLGGDISVSAGPAGRTVEGNTDVTLRAEIYVYARSRGLFAGISLEGASLAPDGKAAQKFYGRKVDPEAVLFDHSVPRVPEAARRFMQVLR